MNEDMLDKIMERVLLAERRITRLEKTERDETNPPVIIRVTTSGTAWTNDGAVRIGSKIATYGTDLYGRQQYRLEQAEEFTWK